MKKGRRIAAVFLMFILLTGISGCGVNQKSPEGVVKSSIEAYGDDSAKNARKCFGSKESDKETEAEIEASIKYIQAHQTDKVDLLECGVIEDYGKYSYVYITYNLVLDKKKEYPCIGTYMVKKSDKKYYIMSSKEITQEISEQASTAYASFMNTEPYQDYSKAYEKFIKQNPGYEERISEKL